MSRVFPRSANISSGFPFGTNAPLAKHVNGIFSVSRKVGHGRNMADVNGDSWGFPGSRTGVSTHVFRTVQENSPACPWRLRELNGSAKEADLYLLLSCSPRM